MQNKRTIENKCATYQHISHETKCNSTSNLIMIMIYLIIFVISIRAIEMRDTSSKQNQLIQTSCQQNDHRTKSGKKDLLTCSDFSFSKNKKKNI